MADFRFTAEDLNRDDVSEVMQREMGKHLVSGNAPKTTASRTGKGVHFGVFSFSEIMQGTPAISSGTEVLAMQESMAKFMITASLNQHDDDDSSKGLNFKHPFAFMVPDDVKVEALKIGQSLTDEDGEPLLTTDSSGNLSLRNRDDAANNAEGSSGRGTSVNGNPYADVPTEVMPDGRVKTDASALLSMPNFLAGTPVGSAEYRMFEEGKVKPELVRMLMLLCQVVVPFFPGGIFSIRSIASGSKRSNHSYYAAVDIFHFAYPDDPTNKLAVESPNSDKIIMEKVYPLLNGITGPARPDEIGGPTRLPVGTSSNNGAFYQDSDHFNHIHIGYEYDNPGGAEKDAPPLNGEGGVRRDSGQNEVFQDFPTIIIPPTSEPSTGRVNIPPSKDILEIVKASGVSFSEVDGWRQRSAGGTFEPVGIMAHHTVGSVNGPAPSLNVCIHGRSDVSGPLANFLIGRDGVVHIIAAGKANGSGLGDAALLERVKRDLPPTGNATSNGTVGGNSYFYNIEVENTGVGEPYPPEQIDALIRLCAALCLAYDWTENRVVHHREWTSRKIDMSWTGDLRGSVKTKITTAKNRRSGPRRYS